MHSIELFHHHIFVLDKYYYQTCVYMMCICYLFSILFVTEYQTNLFTTRLVLRQAMLYHTF